MTSYAHCRKERLYAGAFGFALVLLTAGAMGVAFSGAGSVVLGTEVNANGSVEYLCLGRSCENMQAMDW